MIEDLRTDRVVVREFKESDVWEGPDTQQVYRKKFTGLIDGHVKQLQNDNQQIQPWFSYLS